MPRHAPTRRDRRFRDWDSPPPPDEELDPNWKPARRDSRIPAWVPAPLHKVIRVGFRLGIAALCLLVAVALFYFFLSFRHDLKEITRMPERSIIFDLYDEELATLHGESRRLIEREQIPDFFVKALLAREDKRFFKHRGVDWKGLIRATLRNTKDRSFTQGASTLTMQLARNTFDLRARNLHRKLIEIALAIRVEWKFSKDEILTSYVNRIYFGSGCHGLDEAAHRYFGIGAAELNPNQAALLAGIIRAPHAFSPLRNLEAALRQRDEVLARLVAENVLATEESDEIAALPLGLRTRDRAAPGNAALHAVRRHFEELLASHEIHQGGLRLRSTIHRDIQVLLESELKYLLQGLDEEIQVAAICINAPTGGIRGIVGGRSADQTPFNRALDARRDLGALAAPFLYAAAAERGKQPLLDQPVATGRSVGHDEMVKLLERFGFEGPFAPGDDLYRGALGATPLEVAIAAATLTGRGERPRHHFLKEIHDAAGSLIFETSPSATSQFESRAAVAALAMQFPEGEPRLLTALSPSNRDVWAVSCGSRYAICLWLGYDQPRALPDPETLLTRVHNTIERIALSLTP